jgi:hypothetical protein
LDCPNSEIEIEVEIENGAYRIRVYSLNLETAFDENPSDYYKIEMWKEINSKRNVLQRYTEK